MKLELLGDSLKFLEAINGLYRISGSAIHPCKTYHPKDWAKVRQYVEPYLEAAAPTLVGKGMLIDHTEKLPEENRITYAVWQDGALVYEGVITEKVYDLFKMGLLKPKVSVGINWMKPGGGVVIGEEGQVIPYSFDFAEFSLLMNLEPGDTESSLKIWEGVLTEAVEEVEKSKIRRIVISATQPYETVETIVLDSSLRSEAKQNPTPYAAEDVAPDPISRLRRLLIHAE